MKEATGEVSGVIVTIVIIALILGIGTWLFSANGPAKGWINDIFENKIVNEANK